MVVRLRTTDAETTPVIIAAHLDVITRLQTTDAEIFTAPLDLIEDTIEHQTTASHTRLTTRDMIHTHLHTRGLQLVQDTGIVMITATTAVIVVRKGNRRWVD